MTNALAHDSRNVMLELHLLLRDLDPARFRDELRETVRARVERISRALKALLEQAGADAAPLKEHMEALWRTLDERAPRPGLPTLAERRAAWTAYYEGLEPAYEAVAARLRDYRVHVPTLRPTNYARNAFHVCWGLIGLSLIEFVLTVDGLMWAAGGFAVYGWTTEATRRIWPRWNEVVMKLYGRIAHPHEWHRVNSATWYATALVALAATRSPLLCAVGVAVLAVADPAAALIGRRFGRIKLINGRSLEGSLAFVFAGVALTAPLLAGLHGFGWPHAFALAAGGSLTGALAELVSKRVDDNLTIPIATAAGTWGTAALLGVSLFG